MADSPKPEAAFMHTGASPVTPHELLPWRRGSTAVQKSLPKMGHLEKEIAGAAVPLSEPA